MNSGGCPELSSVAQQEVSSRQQISMRSLIPQPAGLTSLSRNICATPCHNVQSRPAARHSQHPHHTTSRSTSSSSGSWSPPQRHPAVFRCQAAPDAAADVPEPGRRQQPAGAGRGSAWGSGWSSKRSSGSVFKKQQQPQKAPAGQQGDADSNSKPDAAAAAAEQLDPQLEASIRMNVERANQTLQEIVQEVLGELLVEEASAYVLGDEEAGLQLNQAVRGAVVKRLEWLDANFLAAVNAFLAVPGVTANPELAALLGAVRTETLALVSARLPAPVQVLNAALGHSRRSGREGVVSLALGGGAGEVPGTSLDALGAAAHQLIDDMEDQQVVADRVLLARLVLLREELRALAERQSAQAFWDPQAGEPVTDPQQTAAAAAGPTAGGGSSSSQPFFAFHRSNLPARCAAFLKNLLGVAERNKRLGLLTKTFQEDWMAESPSSAAAAAGPSSSQQASQEPTFSQQRAATRDTNFGPTATQPDQQQRQEAPDIVRPGRLLTTLHAMRQELEVQLVSAGLDSPAGGEALDLLQRLDSIRVEALVALDRVQHSRPGVAEGGIGSSSSSGGSVDSSNASSSGSSSALDYEVELEEHDAALAGMQQ